MAAAVDAAAKAAGSHPPDSMGYDVRITRSVDWTENRGLEISQAEWLTIVNADPELTLDPINGPLAASFGAGRWFDWFEGNIFTSDPDHATVRKMLDIAHRLSGAVQGDGGEFYDSATQWSRSRSP